MCVVYGTANLREYDPEQNVGSICVKRTRDVSAVNFILDDLQNMESGLVTYG